MKKLLIFAVAALLVYCAGQSVYKTMEAEKERKERETKAE